MGLLEEFQQNNRDKRAAYANDAVEEKLHVCAVRVGQVLKNEKIKEDKAKTILCEGFDLKPSQAAEIWGKLK